MIIIITDGDNSFRCGGDNRLVGRLASDEMFFNRPPSVERRSFVSKGRISRGGTFERARTDPFSNLLFSKPSLETVMVVVIVVVSVEKKKEGSSGSRRRKGCAESDERNGGELARRSIGFPCQMGDRGLG